MSAKLNKVAMVVAGMVMATGAWAAGNTASLDAATSVTLYEPITMTAVNALRFGKVARDTAGGAGSIEVLATGGVTNTGVTLVNSAEQGPASFTITGTSGAVFQVSVGTLVNPVDSKLTLSAVTLAGSGGLTLDGSASGALSTAFDGSATLSVGATLTIEATAVASSTAYTAGKIPVTVTYQ